MTDAAGSGPQESDTFLGTIIVREGFADADTIVKHVRGQLAEREKGIFRPFGEYLVDKGVITSEQLRKCLRLQRGDAGRSARQSAVRDTGKHGAAARDKRAKKTRKMMGRYELLGKIGQGAMGTVYLSYDTDQKVDVALKVLPKDLADDPEFVARFSREAELASKVRHPNLVLAYGTGTHKGYHYIAFEYVSGGSLDFHLERTGPLSEKRALLITRDIVHALQAASDHGIVHRDMKPDNILLDRDGTAKLTDLGLSMAYDPGDPRLTAPGMAIGTPFYISPELARGVRDVDVRSDLYSLGATLYHIVTGQVPYESENSVQVMMAHIKEPVPRCRDKRPELSAGIEALIMKLMAKKPEDRYQSCTEVLQAIERVLEGKMPDEAEPGAKKVEIKDGDKAEIRRPRKIGSTDKFKRVTQTGRQSPVGASREAAEEADSSNAKNGKSAGKPGTRANAVAKSGAGKPSGSGTRKRGGKGGSSEELKSVPELGALDETAEDLMTHEDGNDDEADAAALSADDTEAGGLDEVEDNAEDRHANDDAASVGDDEEPATDAEDGPAPAADSDEPEAEGVEVGEDHSSAKRSTRTATGERGDSVRTSGRRGRTRRTDKVSPGQEAGAADPAGGDIPRGRVKWIILGVVILGLAIGVIAFLLAGAKH